VAALRPNVVITNVEACCSKQTFGAYSFARTRTATTGWIADGPLLVPKEESEREIISVLAKAPLNGRSLRLYQLMDQGCIG
jgi:hypothetical protein